MKRILVFIPGLFGGVNRTLLEDIEQKLGKDDIRIIPVTPGSLSSVHDRATEAFYQLYGGRVDYGPQHSQLHKHDRHGRKYEGFLSNWDSNHPIDIVSYSLGAPTARYLQYLLITQAFTNENGEVIPTNGDWVRSITTLMGTNNGSPLVHLLGLSFDTLEPIRYSILWGIYMFFYFCQWFFGPKFDRFLPLNLDHWKCTWSEKPLFEALGILSTSTENAGKDLSPKRMYELNKEMASRLPHPNTFYLACVATTTGPIIKSEESSYHLPSLSLIFKFPHSTVMIICSTMIGLFGAFVHHSAGLASLSNEILESGEGIEATGLKELQFHHHQHKTQVCNDGLVNLAGQRHPYFERATSVDPLISLKDFPEKIEKGIWYHVHIANWNHQEIMKTGRRQALFIEDLLRFLQERIN